MSAKIIKYSNLLKLMLIISFFALLTVKGQSEVLSEEKKIFKLVEEGFNKNSIDKFSGYFSDKVYLSLSSGAPKYYSSNQAYYVIKDFLRIYSPAGFKFDFSSTENAFASGVLKFVKNGIKGKFTIFVTLQKDKAQWKISNITIN